MSNFDATGVKAQLRLTALRLGQLQERKDSQAQITRRDIATLLQQGNLGLARAKAQNLIQEDAMGDLLEVLEMHVGVLLEHFNELEHRMSPSPIVVEAASSIIFAAPQVGSKDLSIVRDHLVQYLGPDFARSAIGNRDNYVSSRVIRALSAPPISATKLNDYLSGIADTYGVKWTPELRPQEVLDALSEILDSTSSPVVDLPKLRKLCMHGIPDDPSWLRPRIWKILFGIYPLLKSSWGAEIHKQRESYYDLIRRLLLPFSSLPPPTTPLSHSDASLMDASNQLSRVPHNLFGGLGDEPEQGAPCPLDEIAPDGIKIECAANLDNRLNIIRESGSQNSRTNATPEIRLESDSVGVPDISLSEPESFASRRPGAPTTLLHSRSLNLSGAHKKHTSALLRLLYVHNCLNPANHSPHIPSLLVPLYSVLIQEIEPQDLAHAEADTFWLFEAVVGEFAELEDEEGGNLWMKRLGERLAWADEDLSTNLHAKGLNPALPHYSYRWLGPLLTQTLPLSSVFMVWDALFSCPMRERDSNPKLEYLLDICTSMLIRARAPLFRLGKPGRRSPGLWVDENATLPPPSPLRAWELGDAFLEGMSLLQLYPIEAAGGIDIILQTASDLAHRREEEAKARRGESLSLGARLKVSMWKGFTNQISTQDSPDSSPEEDDDQSVEENQDDGNETETPHTISSPGLTSRLATTVWRGITNQSSMEAPPSPLTPLSATPLRSPSPAISPSPSPHTDSSIQSSPVSQGSSSIWGYAEKLKDSDTAAALAKVSSNWRAKAMDAWNTRGNAARQSPDAASPPGIVSPSSDGAIPRSGSFSTRDQPKIDDSRRGSLPGIDRSSVYSPPARPTFFRPPRDSMLPQPRQGPPSSAPTSPELSPQSDGGLFHRTKNIRDSLASLTGIQNPAPVPAPKSGPRPLLLGSSSVVRSSHPSPIMRSATNTPTPHQGQWSDVLRTKGHMIHRDSQSSISSLSPSDAVGKPWKGKNQSDWESDTSSSRIVPINRRAVSPMAPSFRMPHGRLSSVSSSGTASDRGLVSPPYHHTSHRFPSESIASPSGSSQTHSEKGWGQVELPDSPPTIASPPIPRTPIVVPSQSAVRITDVDHQRGSVVLSESNMTPLEPPLHARKIIRKKTPPPSQNQVNYTSDSSVSQTPSRSPRLRTKRHQQKPANLRIRANSRGSTVADQKTPSPNSLMPDWPGDFDIAITPRANTFDADDVSSTSPRSVVRVRKVSTDGQSVRTRKVSTGSKEAKRTRDSAAEEGDDEGYDDLLSAYESEEAQ